VYTILLFYSSPNNSKSSSQRKPFTIIEKNGLKFVTLASFKTFLWIFEKIQHLATVAKIHKAMYGEVKSTQIQWFPTTLLFFQLKVRLESTNIKRTKKQISL